MNLEDIEFEDSEKMLAGLVGRTILRAAEIEDDADGHGIALELDDGRDLVFFCDEEEGLVMIAAERDVKPEQ